jgi:hypothetical protein
MEREKGERETRGRTLYRESEAGSDEGPTRGFRRGSNERVQKNNEVKSEVESELLREERKSMYNVRPYIGEPFFTKPNDETI